MKYIFYLTFLFIPLFYSCDQEQEDEGEDETKIIIIVEFEDNDE